MNAPLSKRVHTSLRAHTLHLSARRARHHLRNLLQVNAAREIHLPRVDLQDVQAGVLSRRRKLNLAIDAARSEQGRVQYIDAIGRHDHLDGR